MQIRDNLNRRRTDAKKPRNQRRRYLSVRFIKTALVAGLWLSATIVVLVASFAPAVAPENVEFWRITLGIPALMIALITVVFGARMSDKAFDAWMNFSIFPALAFNLILLQITPATQAVLFNVMVALMFAGYVLSTRSLLIAYFGSVGIALSTLFTEPASQTPHLGSFLVVYLTAVTLTVALTHLQNLETLSALGEVRRRALTDPLTGLANLRALRRSAKARFAPSTFGRGSRGVTGLILLDLDNFKSANSRYGHVGGDHALRMIAKQLKRVVAKNALVARVGGDEFAILVQSESRARIEQLGEIYQAAVRAAGTLIDLPGLEIDAAIGIAVYPEDGTELTELLGVADQAMYANKGEKRHTVPNLEANAAADSRDRPGWLDEPDESEVHAPDRPVRDLNWATGGTVSFLASRTMYARSSAIAWAIGSLVVGLSLAVPGAYPSPPQIWLIVMFGSLLSPLALIANVRPQTPVHLFLDLVTMVIIAIGIALTGGIESAISPVLIMVVASQAWFWGTRLIAYRAIGPALVAASPLFYTDLNGGTAETVALTSIYAFVVVLLTCVFAMNFNRRMLSRLQRDTERLAMTDPLTEISNRRYFNRFAQEQLDAGSPEEFAIVVLDLDNFKRVNTERGHRAGDETLQAIAASLVAVAREDDCVARVGGDEFAAVLPGVGVDQARALAERLVRAVSETPEAIKSNVSASAGFALYPLHGQTLDQLVFTADGALMTVKASGKGSTRVARIVTAVG